MNEYNREPTETEILDELENVSQTQVSNALNIRHDVEVEVKVDE